MRITHALLKRLPKVELHCHLDGSLRVPTILDLAKKDKVTLITSSSYKLSKLLVIGKTRGSLEDYIKRFDITLSVMQTPQALTRTAYELIEDVAKENVRYIEIRYSPILHKGKGMTMGESVEAVREGLKRGQKDFGVKSGIIVCGIRNISAATSLKLADLTVRYKNKGVVGFDLAGAEENFPAKDHQEAFYMILNNNINATIHAGEAYGPSSIHQAIHHCGAHHRIALEVCLTSNWQTRSIRSLKYHPLKYYYDQGIRVTINTDNRLMSGTTLTKEFLLAHKLFGFKLYDFREMIIMAMKSAFIPYAERKQMIRKIADELEQDFGLMPEFIERKN